MDDKWVRWLLGGLVVAFMTWASVVWDTGRNVSSVLQQARVEMVAIRGQSDRNAQAISDHRVEPAHGEVLLLIQKAQLQSDVVIQDLRDIKADISELRRVLISRSYNSNGGTSASAGGGD